MPSSSSCSLVQKLSLDGSLLEVAQRLDALVLSIRDDLCIGELVSQYIKTRSTMRLTSGSITGELSAPLDVGASTVGTGSDSVQADGAQDAGVGELGAGGDDAVGDGVVDGLNEVSG